MSKIKQKTIYELDLHECTIVQTNGTGEQLRYTVLRVAGGWFYEHLSTTTNTGIRFFVPYNTEFQTKNETKMTWEE